MPSFENFIVGAPIGFAQGCLSLNELALSDVEYFSELVNKSLKKCDYIPKDPREIAHKNQIKSLNYIIRSSRQCTPLPTMPQIATTLDTGSFLTRDTVEKIVIELQEFAGNADSEVKIPTKASGQMSNFEWRIGVALSSSRCSSLYAPYVAISFDVLEPNGQTTSHSAELSYEQFKEFSATFDKVGRVMDAL